MQDDQKAQRQRTLKQNNEQWKSINGYPYYKISSLGNVFSLARVCQKGLKNEYVKKEKMLIPTTNSVGYKQVGLSMDGISKIHSIHRLVATHFVSGQSSENNTVNHLDGNKTNNHHSNLEWTTPSGNSIHSYRILGNKSSLTGKIGANSNAAIAIIQFDLNDVVIKTWGCISDVKRTLGYDIGCISKAIKNNSKSYGFKWKKA